MSRSSSGALLALGLVLGVGAALLSPSTLGWLIGLVLVLVLFLVTRKQVARLARLDGKIVWPALLYPTVYGMHVFLGTVGPVALAALVLLTLRPRAGRLAGPLPALLVLACGVPILVGNSQQMILVSGLSLFLGYRVLTRFSRPDVLYSLIDGIGLFLIVNVGLFLIGVQSPSSGSRTGGLILAGGAERAFFPLGYSIMTGPVMAGLFLAAAVAFHGKWGWRQAYRILAALAAIVILLESGSRFPLLVAGIVGGVSLIRPRILRTAAVPIGILAFSLPLVFPLVQNTVVVPVLDLSSATFSTFQDRADSGDATLNGRSIIWENSLSYWRDGQIPSASRVYGFGSQGQMTSGASATYTDLFEGGYTTPLTASAHSTGLQQLFDGGVVGLVALISVFLLAIRNWGKTFSTSLDAKVGLAVTLSAVVSAATEVMISPGYGHAPFAIASWVVLLSCVRDADTESPRCDGAAPATTSHRSTLNPTEQLERSNRP